MAIQNSEPDSFSKAARIIFPNIISFFTENILGLLIVGLSLFREWDLLGSISSDSDLFARMRDSYDSISDAISGTSYGRVIVTVLFWSLIGIFCYLLVVKTISYFSAAWRVVDEKQHDVFPRWYSGGSYFHDTAISSAKWIARHVVAITLLIFSLYFCLPLSIAYMHVGVFGGSIDYLSITYGILSLIFATRLFGISLCIFSKKLTAWYVS